MKFQKVLTKFTPKGGKHCVTCSVRQIFSYYDFPMSEEMLFGLASGLGFYYIDDEASDFPFFGGRVRIGDFEDNLAALLNIHLDIRQTDNKDEAYEMLRQAIIDDKPVMVYVDMHYLRYLTLPEDYHFGGHTVIVYGIDEELKKAYISDTDSKGFDVSLAKNVFPADFHLISLKDLAEARHSRHMPFPPNNRMLVFDFSHMDELKKEDIYTAIHKNMDDYLHPKHKQLGIKGIPYFADKIVEWDRLKGRKFREYSFDAFLVINQISGNGGGCFRRMYSIFLLEAADFTGDQKLGDFAVQYGELADIWDFTGNEFYKLSYSKNKDDLHFVRDNLFDIAEAEETLAFNLLDYVKGKV